MPAMRPLLLCLFLLPCCRHTLPHVDDKTGPEQAFRTFRSAVANGEFEREYACLSDGLRRALGLRSRANWADARVTVLTDDHRLIRGIAKAKIIGSRKDAGGRVMLRLDLPFGYKGRVWMAPVAILRVWTEGRRNAAYYQLEGLQVVGGRDHVGVQLPPDVAAELQRELAGKKVTAFVARTEWFLDGFAAGDDTPEKIRKDLERRR